MFPDWEAGNLEIFTKCNLNEFFLFRLVQLEKGDERKEKEQIQEKTRFATIRTDGRFSTGWRQSRATGAVHVRVSRFASSDPMGQGK